GLRHARRASVAGGGSFAVAGDRPGFDVRSRVRRHDARCVSRFRDVDGDGARPRHPACGGADSAVAPPRHVPAVAAAPRRVGRATVARRCTRSSPRVAGGRRGHRAVLARLPRRRRLVTDPDRRQARCEMNSRGFWPMRDLPTVGWLVAAVAATLVHPFVPEPRWLMIHLLVLGAAGHAILVWSRYFADTLLRCPPAPRREQTARLGLVNGGVVVLVVGMLTGVWAAVALGAALLVTAVVWHACVLMGQLRRALANRFAPTAHFYVAAGCLLPIGAVFGAWMAYDHDGVLHERLRLAHIAVNVLGFLGLTVLGPLITLWPPGLRTRISPGAERTPRRAVPVLLCSVGVLAGGALTGWRAPIVVGLLGYLTGIAVLARPAIRSARTKPPTSFAAWSILCAVSWLVACLIVATVAAATVDLTGLGTIIEEITPLLAVGFVAQILVGALSYLVPVVLGGGPSPVRAANRVFDAGGPTRLVMTNVGLVVCAFPVPSLVRVVVSMLVLGALASFVPILFAAMRASRRAKAAARQGGASARPVDPVRTPGRPSGLAIAGLAAVLVATATGAAFHSRPHARPTQRTRERRDVCGPCRVRDRRRTRSGRAEPSDHLRRRGHHPDRSHDHGRGSGIRDALHARHDRGSGGQPVGDHRAERVERHRARPGAGHRCQVRPAGARGKRCRGRRSGGQKHRRVVFGGRPPSDGHGADHQGQGRSTRHPVARQR